MALYLAALFFLQGIPLGAGQGGTISGVLRGADGKPLPSVRVAAVSPPETINDRSSAAMSGLAETDEQGRYSIEGIPQGRYYIAAGRVDFPTYFPGTLDLNTAKILSVMSGVTVSGIDFAMDDLSARDPQTAGLLSLLVIKPSFPVQVSVADGGKIPLFSNGKFVGLRFTDLGTSNSIAVGLNAASLTLQSQAEFDVRVEDLPEGYVVQSMMHGSTDLQTTRLKVPEVQFNRTTGSFLTVVQGKTVPFVPAPIVLVLRAAPTPSTGGVRVSGRVRTRAAGSVYLSGVPGTLYMGGTFEFRGVPPGKHVLAGLDTVSPLGALVAVGDRDVTGLELLDEVSPVPFNSRAPRPPEPLGAAAPGTMIPLASVRGSLVEEITRKPMADGDLKITGYAKTETFVIDSQGRFEIPRLFPGTYQVEIETFGHETVNRTLTVGMENVTLDLTSRRLY